MKTGSPAHQQGAKHYRHVQANVRDMDPDEPLPADAGAGESTETPRERLARIKDTPDFRDTSPPPWLGPLGLVILIGLLAVAAILAGLAILDVFKAYTDRIDALSS